MLKKQAPIALVHIGQCPQAKKHAISGGMEHADFIAKDVNDPPQSCRLFFIIVRKSTPGSGRKMPDAGARSASCWPLVASFGYVTRAVQHVKVIADVKDGICKALHPHNETASGEVLERPPSSTVIPTFPALFIAAMRTAAALVKLGHDTAPAFPPWPWPVPRSQRVHRRRSPYRGNYAHHLNG